KQTLGERVGAAHDLQWASGGSSINASRTLRDDVFQRYFSNLLRATFTQYKRFRNVVGAVTESYGAEHSAYLPELVRYHDYSMILFGRLFCRARAGIERNRMVL
ncbi:hypothetical protein, partial [Paraburkholderia sp. BR14320]|uniref:hypothetical protein n=1 Tax=unclassified Paraburkholderia TaxID=2615204 RepID=UPI0034CF2E3A